jgi:hypothetical protein
VNYIYLLKKYKHLLSLHRKILRVINPNPPNSIKTLLNINQNLVVLKVILKAILPFSVLHIRLLLCSQQHFPLLSSQRTIALYVCAKSPG